MLPGSGDLLPIIITIIIRATAARDPVHRRGHTGTTGNPTGNPADPARIIIHLTAGQTISASVPVHSMSAGGGDMINDEPLPAIPSSITSYILRAKKSSFLRGPVLTPKLDL